MAFNSSRRGQYEESSLDQYLKEISAYPLLTREDEVELAGRIRQGDEEANHPGPDKQDQRQDDHGPHVGADNLPAFTKPIADPQVLQDNGDIRLLDHHRKCDKQRHHQTEQWDEANEAHTGREHAEQG